jgi:hypothetical protein
VVKSVAAALVVVHLPLVVIVVLIPIVVASSRAADEVRLSLL